MIAGIALLATLSELRRARKDRWDERTSEIESVAVITKVIHRPIETEADGQLSRWKYKFVVDNPGRLPISNVKISIDFQVEVQRLHYNGSRDEPTRTLDMIAPVVAAHAQHEWLRTVLVSHEDRHLLRDTVATVMFETTDRGKHVNHWPRRLKT